MNGNRNKYNDLQDNESFYEFFKRHTNKRDYSTFLTSYNHLVDFVQANNLEITEIGDKEAEEFCMYLKDEVCGSTPSEASEKSGEEYVKSLSIMFSWIVENTNYLEWQPFSDVLNTIEFEYDERPQKKRDVPIDDLRQYIHNISSPTLLLLVVLLLKTGLRLGEAANLDYRDIHLDHQVSELMEEPRSEIQDLKDTIYVDSSKEGSKKKSYREIPIDQELKLILIWYIKLSPPATVSPQPLFIDLISCDGCYNSRSTTSLWEQFTNWSKNIGLWVEENHPKNVHPHWCRHWFTTVLRANIDDRDVLIGDSRNYVKGLRGDQGEDVIDTYSHEWESLRSEDDPTWREIYLDAMPLLLTIPNSTSVEVCESWRRLESLLPEFTNEK